MTHESDDTRPPVEQSGSFEVRAAVESEAAAMERLSTGHIAGKGAFIRAAFRARSVLVAYAGERVVGYAIWDRQFFGRPFVWLLGVDANFRRKGVGQRLLHAVSTACLGEPVFTSTNESNSAMHALLARAGFTHTGRVENLDPGDPEIFYFRPPVRW